MNTVTNINTIWKPAVRSAEVPIHFNSRQKQADQQHITRTSLARYSGSDSNLYAVAATRRINERILNSSQSFNSSPKPFVKQWSLSETSSTRVAAQVESTSKQQVPSQQQADLKELSNQQSTQIDHKQQHHQAREYNMSPKLVHQQYNSPIDLYSMKNIRKTIEAHSEMIAPGVKGINFMKEEMPVNKDSEVLKLIKEEEEEQRKRRQQQQQHQQKPLPVSGQPSAQSSDQYRLQYAAEQSSHEATVGTKYSQQQVTSIPVQQATNSSVRNTAIDDSTNSSGAPKCFECGQSIVGPFAKLQDRYIHPQCFNCSTCGTSLKNTGYFTINEKLYCDIHARQVANVMRLNYNFEPNKQAVVKSQQEPSEHQRPDPSVKQIMMEKKAPTSVVQQPTATIMASDSTKPLLMSANVGLGQGVHCWHCCSGMANQATTISTMFRGVSGHHCQLCNNHCSCNRPSEIRWTWRPAAYHSVGDNCQHQKSDADNVVSTTSSSSMLTSSRTLPEARNKHESRLMTSIASGNKSNINSITGERVPICSHCHCQIFGPYILAGKSAWCKPCSQTNFVCSFCHRLLLNIGFIEDSQTGKYHCEHCFETHLAPVCSKCNTRIRGDCLNALGKQWHPNCFVCGHCRNPFGNSSFYLEDNVPYCERDWNQLFTTKCYSCGYPIQVGDKWIEALERNYHSDCFRCTGCQVKLEGSTFYCKGGKPYCRMHARWITPK